jgi:DNA-directed RNA polymerase specialized sigma24 family protein
MSSEGSVTGWLGQLQEGSSDEAAQNLWQRYFASLVDLARLKLRGTTRGMADEEDVALSVLDSFCRGVEQGRFPRLDDRDNLWRLLIVMTAHKVSNLRRNENSLKRGRGVVGQAASKDDNSELEQVIGREPSPEFALHVADAFDHLLGALRDDTLRTIAQSKMEGLSTKEIAHNLNYSTRTVTRKLNLIRTIWQEEEDKL